MTQSPPTLSFLILLLLSATVVFSNKSTAPSLKQFIEISPSAFDVMVHAFDQLVVLFHHSQNGSELNQTLGKLDKLKDTIIEIYAQDHTLFGYVNMTQDYQNSLEKYTSKQQGLYILNKYEVSSNIQDLEQVQNIFQIYKHISHPQLPLAYHKLTNPTKFDHYLVFTFKTVNKLNEYNQMYKRIEHYLQDLQLTAFAAPSQYNHNQSIKLYHSSQSIKEYKFDQNSTLTEKANQLLQQVNIDTLPLVTALNQTTIQRVFGGQISDQILLIYEKSAQNHQLQKVRETFKSAAVYNKEEQLAYERVLFCEINSNLYDQQFNERSDSLFSQATRKELNYVIMMTRTDYDKFNLKRYIYNSTQTDPTTQNIVKFIEDVRMKRLQPKYKSQKVPTQAENNGVLRKIVGESFISQVYQKPDQSIIILFIDSKDEASYSQIKKQLQKFAHKYRYTFDKKLIFGIFDLDKNEHKLLYLKEAPQIVLFDRANKKQSKYYRISKGINDELLKDWINTEVSNLKIIQSLDL